MKRVLTTLLGMLLVGAAPRPAFANAGPGPLFDFLFVGGWLLIPVIMLLTLAGGGYAIRARLRGTRPRRWHSVLRVCAALGLVVSGAIVFFSFQLGFSNSFDDVGILALGYFLGLIVLGVEGLPSIARLNCSAGDGLRAGELEPPNSLSRRVRGACLPPEDSCCS